MATQQTKQKQQMQKDKKKITVLHAMETNLIQHIVYFETIWIVSSKTLKFFLHMHISGFPLGIG